MAFVPEAGAGAGPDAGTCSGPEATERAATLTPGICSVTLRALSIDEVVALAVRAGAPRVRIWAGTVEPAEAGQQVWDAVVEDTRRIAALAGAQGLRLAFEFHGGTLTSTVEGTLRLRHQRRRLPAQDRHGRRVASTTDHLCGLAPCGRAVRSCGEHQKWSRVAGLKR
ncbi:hypothetical protein [Arthrobacter cavernae]|uniref:Xylose isomerase-like TIM barrel domain-containing protein n=1 Tax=Arthrobacter cavernae TaxID=2817681 RepID=A0A939HM21_9MICC|nr:hypothetical protein [Arthrobacter cavernae]MBO1269840.1 hypothetical protein [Arthrobacter cavernae]